MTRSSALESHAIYMVVGEEVHFSVSELLKLNKTEIKPLSLLPYNAQIML